MKKKYPKNYALGQLGKIDKRLSSKNKKILDDFVKLCSITTKGQKLMKIRRHLVQFYDVTGLDLDKQNKDSVTEFLGLLNDSGRSVWTRNEIKVYLKKFLKWFYKDFEMLDLIKTESAGLNPQKITEHNLVNKEEVEKMIRFAENFKEKAIVITLAECGCRPQELLELKWRDITFEDHYADISLFSKKTGRQRVFPVNKARQLLWDWKQNYTYPDLKPQDLVFPSRWRDKPITTNGLNKMLRRLGNKANLGKDVWAYLFRHSKANELYEELPVTDVEKLMGHSNMYKVYSHLSTKKVREQLLNKVYHIEKLKPQEKEEIAELRRKVEDFGSILKVLLKGHKNKILSSEKLPNGKIKSVVEFE